MGLFNKFKKSLNKQEKSNFEYLHNLLSSKKLMIELKSDITLEDGEELKYPEGIELNDFIVIDSENHSIDVEAKHESRVKGKNITLKNGHSKGKYGGAIEVTSDSRMTIENATIKSNAAEVEGGAIVNFGDVELSNCEFEENTASDRGGAIFSNGQASLTIFKTDFLKNTSKDTGGAIANFGKLDINDCQFRGNSTKESSGGAISNQKGILSIQNSSFKENSTPKQGGAIQNHNELTISSCKFDENVSLDGGAIVNYINGWISLSECSLKGNVATEDGGAIINFGKLDINDSDFSENSTKLHGGGAISNQDGEMSIQNCNFKENTVPEWGGVVDNFANLTIRNCELTENTSSNGGSLSNRSKGHLDISDCTFSHNSSRETGGAISNWGNLILRYSNLKGNHTQKEGAALYNDGILSVCDCRFDENATQGMGGAIANWSGEKVKISKSEFVKNISESDGGAINNNNESSDMEVDGCTFIRNFSGMGGGAIVNWGVNGITNSQFENNNAGTTGNSIHNQNGDLKLTNVTFYKSEEENIYSTNQTVIENCEFKEIDSDEVIKNIHESSKRNFRYLDDLLNSGAKEIKLDSDITLDEDEESYYKWGIKLTTHDFVLDGNGHTIDARHKTRIFDVEAEKYSIKNITLKNGRSFGGAIYNRHNMTLSNVTFLENHANGIHSPSAIYNEENANLNIADSVFENNSGPSTIMTDKNSKLTITNSKNLMLANEGGKVRISDSTFSHETGTSSIIHNRMGGKMTVENTLINDNDSDYDIIDNYSTLRFMGCRFENNSLNENATSPRFISNQGQLKIKGCIFENNELHINNYANGEIEISDSEFSENTVKRELVINKASSLKIEGCAFKGNSFAENAKLIMNTKGLFEIRDCEISDHDDDICLIANEDTIEMLDCNFIRNKVKSIIYSSPDSHLQIYSGTFSNNALQESAIHNEAKSAYVYLTSFEKNASRKKHSCDIRNMASLTLHKIKIRNDSPSILNEGEIVNRDNNELERHVKNKLRAKIIEGKEFDESSFSFTKLDELIHSGSNKEILLESDVNLLDGEFDFYDGGIELDIDGMTINGNGHTISGNKMSRIFLITANDITLKNINFKDGYRSKNYKNELNGGGAIQNNSYSEVNIENCSFDGCICEKDGGAILNFGKIHMVKTKFSNNKSHEDGGAIFNHKNSVLISENLEFMNNEAKMTGGAIANEGSEMTMDNSVFENNHVDSIASAICNSNAKVTISNTKFIANSSSNNGTTYQGVGGCILNGRNDNRTSQLYLYNTLFESNTCSYGGAISNYADLNIENSRFKSNASESGGAIFNSEDLKMENSDFEENTAEEDGGAITNLGIISMENVSFAKNKSQMGGAICNFLGSQEMNDVLFEDNQANKGGAIYNNKKLEISNAEFRNNQATEGGGIYNNKSFNYDDPRRRHEFKKSEIEMKDSVFENNSAEENGGAIYNA